jgi:hypothetical protein
MPAAEITYAPTPFPVDPREVMTFHGPQFGVSQAQHDAVVAERDSLKAEVARLKEAMESGNKSTLEVEKALADEIAALKAEVAMAQDVFTSKAAGKVIDALKAEVARLQKIVDDWAGVMAAKQSGATNESRPAATMYTVCPECKRLREALEKYGEHEHNCEIGGKIVMSGCTCGFSDALRPAATTAVADCTLDSIYEAEAKALLGTKPERCKGFQVTPNGDAGEKEGDLMRLRDERGEARSIPDGT